MTAAYRIVASMDIHHQNDDHDVQYRLGKTRYPTEDSVDEFELFICPYDANHKINSKRWRYHLERCKKNYGGRFGKCPFNASHHIPAPELEYHTLYCPDRNVIRQDLEGGKSNWKISTQVNHNPQWNEPVGGTEDWDLEEEDAPSFFLNPDKGMPLALLPQQNENTRSWQEYYQVEEHYEEEERYCQNKTIETDQEMAQPEEAPVPTKSVLDEALLPKQPPNWNDLTKTQKKNYRKKYDRQQQRMKDEDVTEDDFNRRPLASEMTEDQRNIKLAAIKAAYPLNNEKQNATRVDYTSLLNIVCQKIRLNLPEYQPISSTHGGFAYKVRVHQTWYEGNEYCSTKKDAKHVAAKWALLGMDIPGLDGNAKIVTKPKPVHPREREQNQQMREADELGKLMAAGYYPQSAKQLRQPNIQNIGSPSKQNYTAKGVASSQADTSQQRQQQNQLQEQQPQEQKQLQQSSWNGWGTSSNNQLHQQQQNLQQQQEYEQQQFQMQLQERQRQRQLLQQQHQQQQQKQSLNSWNGWRSGPNAPQQPFQYQQHQQDHYQQLSQLQQPPIQQPQQRQSASQWNGWGSNSIASPRKPLQQQIQQQNLSNPPPSTPWLQSAMENLDIKSGEEFPSLGDNVWKAVPKKSAGVNNARRGAGRGRGTSMKL